MKIYLTRPVKIIIDNHIFKSGINEISQSDFEKLSLFKPFKAYLKSGVLKIQEEVKPEIVEENIEINVNLKKNTKTKKKTKKKKDEE